MIGKRLIKFFNTHVIRGEWFLLLAVDNRVHLLITSVVSFLSIDCFLQLYSLHSITKTEDYVQMKKKKNDMIVGARIFDVGVAEKMQRKGFFI